MKHITESMLDKYLLQEAYTDPMDQNSILIRLVKFTFEVDVTLCDIKGTMLLVNGDAFCTIDPKIGFAMTEAFRATRNGGYVKARDVRKVLLFSHQNMTPVKSGK